VSNIDIAWFFFRIFLVVVGIHLVSSAVSKGCGAANAVRSSEFEIELGNYENKEETFPVGAPTTKG
jgi:hypothetical protein